MVGMTGGGTETEEFMEEKGRDEVLLTEGVGSKRLVEVVMVGCSSSVADGGSRELSS